MTYRPPEQKAYSGMFAHFSSDTPASKRKAAAE
jgi:hypothetical protein